MKIVVVGAGAGGGLFGGLLARSGETVSFVARGRQLEALRGRGLRVESPLGNFEVRAPASEDPASLGPAELVLVAVKTWQLKEVAPRLGPLVRPGTVVVPLENGVEAADVLSAALRDGSVVGGLCHVLAWIESPGLVRHGGPASRATLGERWGGPSERLERIAAAFRAAGIEAVVTLDAQPRSGGKFIQMEDEIASLCAIIGASLTGRKLMTATSGPGFSLMQEALGYAIMAEIPCVIVHVQRGGPSTGIPTHVSQGDVNQARWGTHGEHSIIALTASNHQDVFAITVEAFNMSETYRTPVILLFDEVVAHMRERLVMPEPGGIQLVERLRTSVKEGVDYHPYLPREDGRLPMSDFGGVHRYNVTGLVHDMWGFPSTEPRVVHALMRHLIVKLANRTNELARFKEFHLEDAETILISYGSSARSALHVVEERRQRGERLGLVELQTLWPFPRDIIRNIDTFWI